MSNTAIANEPPATNGSGDARPVVCHVLHSLNVGGAEMLAFRMARLMQDEFRFIFACLDERGEMAHQVESSGFPIHHLNRQPGVDFQCMARLAVLLAQHEVSVVHSHQFTPFFYSVVPKWKGRRPPVIFTEHGRTYPDYRRPKRVWFNRFVLRKCDRVVAVGKAVRRALVTNEGFPERRIDVIYNGIDLERFSGTGPSRRDDVRRSLGLSTTDFIAILVGRFDPVKRHDVAVRMAAIVSRHCPHFKLLFAGDGDTRADTERLVSQMNVGNVVRFLGMRDDVPDLLAAADVCMLSSDSEGIPLSLIEGMASRKPVVATDVGGVGEVVVDGETGLLVQPGDPQHMADAIVQMATDTGMRTAMGDAGHQRAWQLFSETAMHKAYASLYQRLGVSVRHLS